MKIKLDLYHPYELEAFAKFSAAVAEGKAAYDAAQPKDAPWFLGGIDRTSNAGWKTAGLGVVERDETREAVDADGVVTKSNHVEAGAHMVAETQATAEKKTRQRKPKDAPAVSSLSTDTPRTAVQQSIVDGTFGVKSAISTGEERVGPEDDAATIAQDAADEAAETAATKTALTLDDVRNALGGYVNLFGLEAAMTDGPVVITKVCGEGKVKVSDIPEDKIEAVIAGVQEMIQKNPFKREKVAA